MSTQNNDTDQSPEMLPEVQPPTTGFILQLFIIPGLIVLALVVGWLLVRWVVESGSDPKQHFAEIKRGRSNSWQQAVDLAETLQRNPQSKNDSELAADIASHLDSLLDQSLRSGAEDGRDSADQLAAEARLRQFLAIALVNFNDTSITLPVLLKAAGMDDRGENDYRKVRVAALQSISVLADRAKKRHGDSGKAGEPLSHPALLSTLLAASEDDEPVLRNQAAIALGVLGTDDAIERLETMALEPQPDAPNVHYNVATALARNGRESSVELLLEMLQPDKIRALPAAPKKEGDRDYTPHEIEQQRMLEKTNVVTSALQAVLKLAATNKELDLTPLIAVIEELPNSEMPKQIQLEAQQVLRELKNSPAQ